MGIIADGLNMEKDNGRTKQPAQILEQIEKVGVKISKENYEKQCFQSALLIIYSIALLDKDAHLDKILRQLTKFTHKARRYVPSFAIIGEPSLLKMEDYLDMLENDGVIRKFKNVIERKIFWRVTDDGKMLLHVHKEKIPLGIKIKESVL